jgi:hypothetical protein
MDLTVRDQRIFAFRREVYKRIGFVPFEHQVEWQLAEEGLLLIRGAVPAPGSPAVAVLVYESDLVPGDTPVRTLIINGFTCAVVRRGVRPRPGGRAKVIADLAAYKAGKSFGLGNWLAGFAIVPGLIQLIGLEYGTSEPEFNYLIDAVISDRGMRMPYTKLQNDKRNGRMILRLETGCTYEVKSWNRKEALKGARITCYAYTEAYQLPGLECFTSVAQNLRELNGAAVFATTPDRPWVGVFHDFGHGLDPQWSCTCGVDSRCNPFTFSQRARDRDDPKRGGIMTRERFAIAHEGKLGSYVGSVFDYQIGQLHFTPQTHPYLWDDTKLKEGTL